MNECSELRLVSEAALGFHLLPTLHPLPASKVGELLSPSFGWNIRTGAWLAQSLVGNGARDAGLWRPSLAQGPCPSAFLEPLCQLPRSQSCLCLPACIFTVQCASHPTPSYQGNWSLCFWHHPGFSLLFFSPFWKSATLCLPAKQKASSALPCRGGHFFCS